jgi:hypothetical protein
MGNFPLSVNRAIQGYWQAPRYSKHSSIELGWAERLEDPEAFSLSRRGRADQTLAGRGAIKRFEIWRRYRALTAQ